MRISLVLLTNELCTPDDNNDDDDDEDELLFACDC